MFGYVRPYMPELKVREMELYRAAYCGLCAGLGRSFGFLARCTLAYDLVFLTMLLAEPDSPVRVTKKRCPVSLKRKRCLDCDPATGASAAYCVILAYHKLRDDAGDERFPKSAAARIACAALGRAYRRSAEAQPAFDTAARGEIGRLRGIETDAKQPLDAAADAFAKILAAAVPGSFPESRRRALETLLYHIGRWIYILDARDDLEEDAKRNRTNAILARPGNSGSSVRDKNLALTLDNSLSVAGSALELLDESEYSGILRNIIYLGLPAVQEAVFRGEYDAKPRGNVKKII